jgi:hypothetical protein
MITEFLESYEKSETSVLPTKSEHVYRIAGVSLIVVSF